MLLHYKDFPYPNHYFCNQNFGFKKKLCKFMRNNQFRFRGLKNQNVINGEKEVSF